MLDLEKLAQQANKASLSFNLLDLLFLKENHFILKDQELTKGREKFRSICDLFESQAQASPESIAVISNDTKVKYKDLSRKINTLARYLRSQGVKPGVVVGLSLVKNEHLLVGIFGILKAGGTYLPLDPNYPEERLKYMMEDAKPFLLLTQSALTHKLPIRYGCKSILIDRDWAKVEAVKLDSATEVLIEPYYPAYIIYTSGSTGKPKGILVCHGSLPNVVNARLEIYPRNPIALLVGSISFDPTLLTILYTLIAGGILCMPPNESFVDPKRFVNLINNNSVNFILCVTSFYSMLLENAKNLPSLGYVFLGGETMPLSLPLLHSRTAPQAYLFNEYGPAEHAIGGTIAKIYDPHEKKISEITIGKPLPNVQVYILNEKLQPVSIGAEGEIFIGGIGLAKGYLNNPELTAKKFIWLSLPGQEPIRLYRTGDWGRFLPSENIEFLGRIDHQVKILGHRIELGEIEHVLGQHPNINEAVVVVQEKESKRLIAFFSTSARTDIREELRSYLSRFLPSHMIPSSFVQIDKWPLTPNGKIDRAALLPMLETLAQKRNEIPMVYSSLEKDLSDIWKEVLQIDSLGLNDNFFDLGGNSLQVSHVQKLIEEKLNMQLNIVELFEYPTLLQLATHLQPKIKSPIEKSLVLTSIGRT